MAELPPSLESGREDILKMRVKEEELVNGFKKKKWTTRSSYHSDSQEIVPVVEYCRCILWGKPNGIWPGRHQLMMRTLCEKQTLITSLRGEIRVPALFIYLFFLKFVCLF